MPKIIFKRRQSVEQVEESSDLAPKFNTEGLIPVVTTDFTVPHVTFLRDHGPLRR